MPYSAHRLFSCSLLHYDCGANEILVFAVRSLHVSDRTVLKDAIVTGTYFGSNAARVSTPLSATSSEGTMPCRHVVVVLYSTFSGKHPALLSVQQ